MSAAQGQVTATESTDVCVTVVVLVTHVVRTLTNALIPMSVVITIRYVIIQWVPFTANVEKDLQKDQMDCVKVNLM